jgi:hypothetical protein
LLTVGKRQGGAPARRAVNQCASWSAFMMLAPITGVPAVNAEASGKSLGTPLPATSTNASASALSSRNESLEVRAIPFLIGRSGSLVSAAVDHTAT